MLGEHDMDKIWQTLSDELAQRLAERLAPIVQTDGDRSPWLTTREAIAYSKLPEGTFRKLASSGTIPSHGGRTKLFYRPEVDQALLAFSGIADEERRLRSVR